MVGNLARLVGIFCLCPVLVFNPLVARKYWIMFVHLIKSYPYGSIGC